MLYLIGYFNNCNCSTLILLESCQQTCMTYTIVVCKVKNSWLWTEKLSETCRISFQEYIYEIIASSWFYYKEDSKEKFAFTTLVILPLHTNSVWKFFSLIFFEPKRVAVLLKYMWELLQLTATVHTAVYLDHSGLSHLKIWNLQILICLPFQTEMIAVLCKIISSFPVSSNVAARSLHKQNPPIFFKYLWFRASCFIVVK